jgi:hypothetical protein
MITGVIKNQVNLLDEPISTPIFELQQSDLRWPRWHA